MPFPRPTLPDLVTRVRADFRGRLSILGALLRRAMADVLAVVWAGAVHMLHGHLEFLGFQLFADVSEREFLLRQASLYGITPNAATFASGTVEATGTDPAPIPLGTVLVRDDGATYQVTAGTLLSGGVASVAIEALQAGADGNMEIGDELSFESPLPLVDSTVTVEDDGDGGGLTGGFDEEDTEGTRARLILRLQEPPQGGSEADYIRWALDVAGVTRVWVFRHENGLGTVVIRFVQDDDVPIFPGAPEVATVQAAIDAQRPITAEPTVVAPIDLPVPFTIALTPDTPAIRTAVEAELTDLFFRDAEPGDGAGAGTILLTQIVTAIGIGVGAGTYVLTAPAADVVPALGELATLGTVTYV